jgi:hypothetical protein
MSSTCKLSGPIGDPAVEAVYRTATLHHEAGHAVVCIRCVVPFTEVCIKDSFSGDIDIADEAWDDGRLAQPQEQGKLLNYAVAPAAGLVAGSRVFDGVHLEAAEGDVYSVFHWCGMMRIAGGPQDALLQVMRLARQHVDEHWPAIQEVAAALDQEGKLSREQVAAIFVKHVTYPPVGK